MRHPIRSTAALLAAACLAAGVVRAQNDVVSETPSRDLAVHCGTLLVGDGTTVLRDAWLVIRGGKILSVSSEAPPADLPVVDARGKVVMPGIVAVDTDLAAAVDSDYQVTPDAMAIDSFDFDRNWQSALQGGVTTAYLSPGRQRLVSGQGAVVKLAGRDVVERVLSENACLRINVGDGAVSAPRVFEPVAHPTSDEPLEQSRIQMPTSRISVLAELRALFGSAADADKTGGEGPAEYQYDRQPLADVVAGKLPLRAMATQAHDVRRALQLQQELGVHMVLEDPQEIEAVAALASAQQVAATFRVPVRFGQSNPGGEDRLQERREPHPEAPARAAAAGVRIGLAPAEGVPLRDYLMSVAIAVRHGLSPAAALRGIHADAARILGVDSRVGSLGPGKDADFVVLSGDPLAVGTMVEATWIDGRRVYERTGASRTLAVRAGRILDGAGRTFRSGVLLAQDGRIKSVGEESAVPYGANLIDIPGGVMTPGFVDAFSHLGLAGEGATVPAGAPNQLLHEVVVFDDPMFAPALAEGLTTLLVAGKDGGPVGGRIAAIKTGAKDQQSMVLRAIAGQRFAHDSIGPEAIKPLAEQIQRGKQYVELWRKYEKDLAEWKQGKRTAPAPAPPPPAPTADAPPDPISGTWEADIDIQGQVQLKVTLDLKLDGTAVTGTIRISFAGRELPPQDIETGSFADGTLKMQFRGPSGSASLEATVQGDTMTGKLTLGRMGEQPVTGKRTSKTPRAPAAKKPEAAAAGDDGKPKEPKVDDSLEPLRAAIEKRAALVVRCNRAAAMTDVVDLLEKEQIPFVLQGVDDLVDDPALLGARKPPILVGPDVVAEERGELRNAASIFSDADLPIMFGSGDCAGAVHLPMHAAYAVRYGLSPSDALAAMTLWPARAFQLADRIGSLEKGKDADFVVFSGDPFEPSSRVLLVVCNGSIVVDNREGSK